jgi:putative MATE family efflux protein
VDDHRLSDKPKVPLGSRQQPPEPPRPASLINRGGPTWRLVLMLAWPTLLQQLLVLSVSFSDRLLAGRFQEALGKEDLIATQAAMTTASYLGWLVASYTVLVSVGSTALVARFIGAGSHAEAIHVTNQSILLAAVLGLLGSATVLPLLPAAMAVLGLHGPAAEFALEYLFPLFLLLVFQVIESAGIACMVGAGDTRIGLFVLAGVAVVNVPLAWLCFHGVGPLRGLGFPGIAWGTAISHTLGGIIVLVVLARGRAGLRLHMRLFRPCLNLLRRLLRISVPAGLDSLSVSFAQLWFVSIVNSLGDAASGAHGIALYWEALGYLSGGAFGTAAMALIGQNLGAGRPAQAARSGWTAFGLAVALMSFMGAVFFVCAPLMFALFCPDPKQAPIVEAGVAVLRLVAFAMPSLASCIVFTYALRGAGDTRVPVLFNWFGFFVVRIPLTYLLTREQIELGPLGVWGGLHLGLFGAWLAMTADIGVRGIFFLLRFLSGRWQTIRV